MDVQAAKWIGSMGWWWGVGVWLPFALYCRPFIMADFQAYRHLTIAALSGRYDIAGLHILDHTPVWQLHSSMGLLYMLLAPFQFSNSFRAHHMALHRRMGYAFVWSSIVLGVSGSTTMLFHSEFGWLGRLFMGSAGTLHLTCLAIAVIAAKRKQIQQHRHWMIRAVVMGYTVISSRIVLVGLQKMLQKGLDIHVFKAADYSILGAVIVSATMVEFYIQMCNDKKAI